ncbi:hypothetical protein [Arthrobacter sp. N1]|uniref:hypothetical protein n=1 Tax=Arthrobacter sp. N1 TaxID=619291 RepID=UPI003BAFDA1D
MTIIDRPRYARHSAATTHQPAADTPDLPGGSYVTATTPRPGTEGTYVSTAARATDQARPLQRGTYVTSVLPSVQRGGTYTYAG